MPLPTDITLTVPEVRQVAARVAARFCVPFDTRLIITIDDVLEDVILEAALGPARKGPYDA